MQELAYQQHHIQEALHAMLGSMPELLAQIPDEPQYAPLRDEANGFLEAVAEAKIEEDLTQNGNNLTALDGKAGYELAQQAAEKMDRLISKCSGLPQQGKMCLHFKPSLQQALGNTLEQILAAMGRAGCDAPLVIGGTIPARDAAALRSLGVAGVFPVGTPLPRVVEGVLRVAGAQAVA